MAARQATLIIATRSDASILKEMTAGIHYEVLVCVDRNNGTGTETLSIGERGLHVPVSDIDIAERLGVLAAMYMMVQKRVPIRNSMLQLAGHIQPSSILLFTDRQSLQVTLPKCEAFRFLREKIQDAYGLNIDMPVDVRWECRDREYIQVVDEHAREEWSRIVTPIHFLFDDSFVEIINMSAGWRVVLLKMQRVYLRKTNWQVLVYRLCQSVNRRAFGVVQSATLLYQGILAASAYEVTLICEMLYRQIHNV